MNEVMTTISIARETRNQLAKLGSHDETFDAIIRKLIDAYLESKGEN